MKLNIRNQIRKLSPRINMASVINEAVINAIQAGATQIRLEITRNSSQDEMHGNKPKIIALSITDNGTGFTEENIKSFCEYGSEHKVNEGCKGIGRLCYLKVFDKVRIESAVLGTKIFVALDFTVQFDDSDFTSRPLETISGSETKIYLENIKSSYAKETDIEDIKNNLYYHILPLLYLNADRGIEITIIDNYDNSEASIKTVELPAFEKVAFKVKESATNEKKEIDFTLHYSFFPDKSSQITGFYCANKRTVCEFQDKELKIHAIPNSNIIFLVTSPYFDDAVNDERNDFHIFPKETNLIRPVSWEKINDALKEEIKSIIYAKYPDLKEENSKIIQSIKQENLHLVSYMHNIDSLGGLIDYETLIDKAEKLYQQDKKALKAILKRGSIDSREIIEKASDLAGKELTEYVVTRDKIITQFENMDLQKEENEELIRSHFLKHGLVGDGYASIAIKENNLWLLDDKFMSYNYVASEKTINTLLGAVGLEKSDSQDRFDIGIYSNSEDARRVILIEFKKFSANYKLNGVGIDQLYNYAFQLKEAGINQIYLYLIAKIDDAFRRNLTGNRDFSRIFSQKGEIYHRNYDHLNAYIQIISPDALVSDARARNKTFIDMIKKSVI